MNKFKIAIFSILGISLFYFTSILFNYKIEQRNSVSKNSKGTDNIIQQNTNGVTNNAPRAFLTEAKPENVFKKEKQEKQLRERDENEQIEKDETKDSPEKAVEQDFERTKDPSLNRPTPEVLPGVILNGAIQSFSGALMGLPGAGANTSWIQRGPFDVGGRTRALAWDPNDVNRKKVWAGGVSGGLWYNNDITNAASNWVNVGDVWANLAITKIIFDPNNAQNIYVSTGEGYQVGATRGAGIWKSTDGGNTWLQLSSTTGMTYINDLIVRDEAGTSVIYAAVDGNYIFSTWSMYLNAGLFRSTDGGANWSQVMLINTTPPGTGAPYTPSSISIAQDNRLWVGTKSTDRYIGDDKGGGKILYSDNGTSWTIAKSVAVTNGRGRVTVATAPSDANYIYAFVEKNTTGGVSTISLIKSIDKGATWSDMALPDDVDDGISAADFSRGQAWYDQVLKVDPNVPQTVYIGAIDLFKSTDAGANWTQISKWSDNPGMGSIARLSYVHADQHAMEFKPGSSSIGIFGNDGGVFYSNDLTNASTSSVINARNANYNVTQFYAAAIHPNANTNYYLAGSQDNGTQQFNAAGLSITNEVTGGDGAFCFIDQTNPNYQITSYVYNNLYRSTNGGNNFSKILSENTGSFINPATYDNNLHIYYSYKNNDGTNGVIKRITGINATTSVSDVAITGLNTNITAFKVSPHTTSSTTLFIGTSNSKLIKVTNADGTPTSTNVNTTGFPASASISSIDIGATENELLVTFFNYGVNKIWYTSDGGANWSNKMGNFPNIPARWGMFNPSNRANDVLLATELGIYGTTNFGTASPTWSQLNNGFTNVRTDMLQYRASDKQVIAATYGRGLYSSYGFAITPSITSFTPTTASTGTTVTITGTDFDAITGVSFGGVAAASYTVTSSTSITAVVAGGASGDVAVTNSAGTGSLAGFTYCATANASLTSGVNSNNQTVCNNIPIANITYSTSGTNGVSITGLPGGVSGAWSANVITISGTPTPTSGNFTYTITLTGDCGTITRTGTITIQPTNTLTLSSGAGTNSQTVCISSAINATTYTTTGATNATVTGLPTGITSSWSANVLTISGTPTVAGNYTYTVTTVGGCGVITATGNFVVNQNAIALSSATGTDVQTICTGTSIASITYTTTGATNATFNGLPGGLSASWSANTITISGTPTPTSGTFNYTITLTGGCGTVTKTGTIIISFPNTITLGSAVGTNSQTICINTSSTPIIYNTTDATGATVTGLPAGLSGLWSNNVYTINGIPTASGTYSYTVTTTGGCGVASTTGKYAVTPANTFTLTSAAGTNNQPVCINNAISNITYATTGATNVTVTGLPTGVTSSWAANILTISGTPTATGTFNYTMTTIGGCGPTTATGTITVKRNTITLSSAAGTDSQTVCLNSAITNITFATTGATGATISGLPADLIGSWSGNVFTISGTPRLLGTFNYTITLNGGCDVITKSGVIQISPESSVGTASAASSSICPSSSASLKLTDFTGNLVWQQSTNGTTWTDVTSGTGINSLNYTTQALNTNYSYRAKAINGNCSAAISNVVNITILPPPNAPVISNANITKFCNGDSVKLSSTLATGLVWYNNDVLIPAQTASTYYVKATGTYSAKVFVSGCPSANSNVITIERIELPITPVVTDVSLCKDAAPVTLKAIANTGNTLLWYGTNATGGTSSTNANSISTSTIGTSNYYVSQISTFGCESIRVKIAVNIYGIPSAPSITRDNTNNLISSYTYGNTWYKDQVKLADTSNSIKPLEQGSYTVKAIVNTCPSSISMPYFYLNSVTDITNLNQSEFIKIYPNPIVSDLKINFSLTKFQKVNIAIYSSTSGRKIIDLMNKESGMTIDVRNLISGTYIVIISSKDNQIIYTQKIMKL